MLAAYVACVGAMALGVGARSLVGGVDAFRTSPARPFFGAGLATLGGLLVVGAGLAFASLHPSTSSTVGALVGGELPAVAAAREGEPEPIEPEPDAGPHMEFGLEESEERLEGGDTDHTE